MGDCACAALLEAFAAIRLACPALREVLIPDDLWPRWEEWHRQPDRKACHQSILLLAMERGYLGQVTSALHRYLIREGRPRPDLTQQYRQDLRECWMLHSEPVRRHQRFKIFMGKLTELHVAEWLESQGWTITCLAALGARADIQATVPDGRTNAACEVKFIGPEDEYFCAILKSIARQPSGQSVSPHDAANFLTFKVYEAAKQLERVTCKRIAVVVVDELAWHRFDLQLDEGWIDWENPRFYDSSTGSSDGWDGFLTSQKRARYPHLPGDLPVALRSLGEVWILQMSGGFRYHRYLAVPNTELQRTPNDGRLLRRGR